MSIDKLKSFIEKFHWHILVMSVLLALFFQILSSIGEETNVTSPGPVELDTIIPAGHSLFPLDLINKHSISAVLGDFGVIDLYNYVNENEKKLIAKNIKLFRAPRDPESFYVLVPDYKSAVFIRENNKTFAVIKNRSQHSGPIGRKKFINEKYR